ncbi:ABC-2 family transporter protein [Paenibacillus pasadenensis]|uniref:ABC transporter permease n=1 Tax=Paenibacillus pasadenensis TaxID=217090 RepID=UPI00203E4B0F|nr:ABC-2 family transporter protein [Paenibacillus pasadenensis]MCM3749482.1 ABC-2 family transporter protein [Paenibacillus pasadenensis]
MRAYGYLIKMRVLTALAYRFDVWIGMIGDLILLAASVFIWKAAYGGDVLGSGASVVGLDEMITYTVVSVLMAAVFSTGVQNTIYNQVREGNIALDFMRPLNLLGIYLSEDLGSMVSSLVNKAVPLVLMASLLFGFPMPDSPTAAVLFAASCALSFMILWLMSAMVGLVAFWVAELGNLGMVKDAFIRVLSGSMVPLWFFPEGLQRISEWLPFQYTYQLPLSVYIGMSTPAEALRGMGIQVIWIALLGGLLAWIWTRARGKVMVQGG